MRIHTNLLTESDIRGLVPATAYVGKLSTHKSRKRSHAFELNLGGSGRTGGQWGQQDGKAATWDEWGMFLAALYEADPDAVTPYYEDADDFDFRTGGRFDDLTPEEQHTQHHWEHEGVWGGATHFYCKGSKNYECSATMHRHLR